MARYLLLTLLGTVLLVGCGVLGDDQAPPTARAARAVTRPTATLPPTATPRPTFAPRPTRGRTPGTAATPRAASGTPAFRATPTPAPTSTPVAPTESTARNQVWFYLSQCVSFEPNELEAVQVRQDWLVKATVTGKQKYGIWSVSSKTGKIDPHDSLAQEWMEVVDSQCSTVGLARLLIPTPTFTPNPTPTPTSTPRPVPTATAVVRTTTDAVATLWAHLVKCFSTLKTTDLTSTLDPTAGEYVVKDTSAAVYGVWRVRRDNGSITPDNDLARTRETTVSGGTC